MSGDSSSGEEHVETEKAASFKNLPASVRKMKAESGDFLQKRVMRMNWNTWMDSGLSISPFLPLCLSRCCALCVNNDMLVSTRTRNRQWALLEKDGLQIREFINCKFIMARKSGKIHITLIVCKMLSWPFGITQNQLMKILIMISVLRVKNLGVASKGTFPREQQIMFMNHLFQKLLLKPFILRLKLWVKKVYFLDAFMVAPKIKTRPSMDSFGNRQPRKHMPVQQLWSWKPS